MTFFTFLDERFRTLSLELQKEYTIPKEAELKAAYELIQMQRTLFKWLQMPVLLVKFIWSKLPFKRKAAPLQNIPIDVMHKEAPPSVENVTLNASEIH